MLFETLALVSVVILLVWMFFFTASSLPLLILKHDVPNDAEFISGFFGIHYLGLMSIATVGFLFCVISNRHVLTVAMVCIVLIGVAGRRLIASPMEQMRASMSPTDSVSIRRFRKLHGIGVWLNVSSLAGFLSTIALASAELHLK